MQPADKDAGSQGPWADDDGPGRALIASSDRRAAHVACDSILSSKMCVGAMRM
jgi:hypothetical protein